jgi:hypothetical protein
VREKASEDFDRIVKGTSKTREKLGVRNMLSSNGELQCMAEVCKFSFSGA